MDTDKMNKEMKFVTLHVIMRNMTEEINLALLGVFLLQ